MTERDEFLRPGDIAQLIKPPTCCNSDKGLGRVFQIVTLDMFEIVYCQHCGVEEVVKNFQDWVSTVEGYGIERSRLKKLHPPTDEEMEIFENELELA
jgi:hypothetical protein